jgi:hypothetical protein
LLQQALKTFRIYKLQTRFFFHSQKRKISLFKMAKINGCVKRKLSGKHPRNPQAALSRAAKACAGKKSRKSSRRSSRRGRKPSAHAILTGQIIRETGMSLGAASRKAKMMGM